MPLLCRMPWAPCNGTTSTPPKLVVMLAPNHHVHPQSWPSPSPPTIAHYNGTLRWHPAMAPHPLPQSWSSTPPSTHTTMAICNGTQQWHHVHCTLQWHPGATSNQPKWFVLFVEMFGCSGAVEVHGFGWLWLLIKNLLSFYNGRWYPNFRFLLATILGCTSFRNWPKKWFCTMTQPDDSKPPLMIQSWSQVLTIVFGTYDKAFALWAIAKSGIMIHFWEWNLPRGRHPRSWSWDSPSCCWVRCSEEMNLLLAWAWQQLRFWHHGKEMMCCGENWARNSWMKMKLGFCGRMWHQHIDDCWVAIYGDPRATPWRVTVIVDSWLFNWKWPVGESDDGKINKKRRVTC